ncbi:MAG TPA: hypothetical protein VFJ21_14660 [Mycobacteriales bacterium]|jgi:hypothetical protein|nr:hypothetical protein [Mycobacteriales bacterium]
MTPTISKEATLTPADRCDRCGAQAFVRAVLPGGGDLLFCAHHGRRFADRLRAVAVELHDDRGVLEGQFPDLE